MGVEYEDYYSVLGVDRDASQDEIQKAYKKMARKYHPDVSDEADAEEQFKKVNEAYQVLKDPEKRKKYDRMGRNWKAGQEVDPPPGWENVRVNMGGGGFEDIFGGARGGGGRGGGGMGGFSDFFQAFFGEGGFGGGAAGQGARARAGAGPGGRRQRAHPGKSHRAEVTVTLEDVYYGRERTVAVPVEQVTANGQVVRQRKTYTVKIPPGATQGTTIRLAGEGQQGSTGQRGDVLLKINIAEHPDFEVDGHNLYADVKITPWEAALGGKVEVPTVEGKAAVTVPAGSQSGRKLRLRGKGLKKGNGERGNLYARLSIRVPEELSEQERELYEQLADASDWTPRDD